MKICRTCKREFIPSSRHLDCPSCRHIAKKLPCPSCGNLMQRASTFCRNCAFIGNLNGNWKGGKTRHQKGYVMRNMPEHPRANTSKMYVFEHILVMEDYLGRYLDVGEMIHHKNCIKDDNRIENLELWTTNHPTGCRVSDLLQWAYEIIELYGRDRHSTVQDEL